MKKSKKRIMKLNNAVEPAAPPSVWGYKGCAGKGGKTTNCQMTTDEKEDKNELRTLP